MEDWEKRFNKFTRQMKAKIKINMKEKGRTWEHCDRQYLVRKSLECSIVNNHVDVANYRFMLWDRENRT